MCPAVVVPSPARALARGGPDGRAFATVRPACAAPPRRFDGTIDDGLGGQHRLKYDVTVRDEVVRLDTSVAVQSVKCSGDSIVRITVTDAAVAVPWTPGHILVGSDVWGCPTRPTDARPGPFYARILEVLGMDVAPNGLGVEVAFLTIPVQFTALFDHFDIALDREPGERERRWSAHLAEVTAHYGSRAVSEDGGFVPSNETEVLEARGRSLLGEWSTSETWTYTLVNWNFNPQSGRPVSPRLRLLGDVVFCQDCYAFLGASLSFRIAGKWATLYNFLLVARAQALLNVDVRVNLARGYSESDAINLWPTTPNWAQLPDLVFYIYGFKVRIDVSAKVTLASALESQVQGRVEGPGFWTNNVLGIGIQYDGARWSPVVERQMGYGSRAPFVDIRGQLDVWVWPTLQLRFSPWGYWDITVSATPKFHAQLDWGVSTTGCASNYASLSADFGLVAGLHVADINIDLGWPLGTLRIPLDYTFGPYEIIATRQLGGYGISGCMLLNAWSGRRRALRDHEASLEDDRSRQLSGACGAAGCAWWPSEWSACSVNCGTGVQTRSAACRSSDGSAVLDQECAGLPLPPLSTACSMECVNVSSSGVVGGIVRLPPWSSSVGARFDAACAMHFFDVLQDNIDDGVDVLVTPTDSSSDPDLLLFIGDQFFPDCRHQLPPNQDPMILGSELRPAGIPERIRATFAESSNPYGGLTRIVIRSASSSSNYSVHVTPFHTLRSAVEQTVTNPAATEWTDARESRRLIENSVDASERSLLQCDTLREDFMVWEDETAQQGCGREFMPDRSISGHGSHAGAYDLTRNGTHTEQARKRNFLFEARPGAEGVLIDAAVSASGPEFSLLVNLLEDGWPTSAQAAYKVPSNRHKVAAVRVEGADFVFPSFAISVLPVDLEGDPFEFQIHATEIMPLERGVVTEGRVAQYGTHLFHVRTAPGDTLISIELESLTGDADLYVYNQPFPLRPTWSNFETIYASRMPGCWRSIYYSSESQVDARVITHLDPEWTGDFYVAVLGWVTTEYRIVAQSYEQVDQGTVLARQIKPLEYGYFLSSLGSEDASDEKDLFFALRTKPDTKAPAPISVYGGSTDRFFPRVLQGFSGVRTRVVPPGFSSEILAEYLPTSEIARPMIIGVQSEFHDHSTLSEEASKSVTLESAEDAISARRTARRSLLGKTAVAYDRLTSDRMRPNAVGDKSEFRGRDDGEVLDRKFLSDAQHVRIPDLLGVESIAGNGTGQLFAHRRALAHPRTVSESSPRALHLGDARLVRPNGEPTVVGQDNIDAFLRQHTPRNRAILAGAPAVPLRVRVAVAEETLQPDPHQPSAYVSGGFAGLPSLLGPHPLDLAFWAAPDTDAMTAASKLSGPGRRERRASTRIEVQNTFEIEVTRFAGRRWEPAAVCDVAPGLLEMPPCLESVSAGATETVFFRVPVPPRAVLFQSVVSVRHADGGPSDAAYVLRARLGELPTPETADASAESTGHTFVALNCRYSASVPSFVSVSGNNPAGKSLQFNFILAAASAEGAGLCPDYSWQSGEWGDCSEACGVGTQTRAVWCEEAETGRRADDDACPAASRPASHQPCDQGECVWVPSPWSECSKPCGGGRQMRVLDCRNGAGAGSKVLDGHCTDRPISERTCNAQDCPPFLWYAQPWTHCSKRCGGGARTRRTWCVDSALARFPDDRCDLATRPKSFEACNAQPCDLTPFVMTYADIRGLEAGVPREDEIVAGASKLYLFERPRSSSRGVCIVAKPRTPEEPGCSIQQERRAAACNAQLRACRSNATSTGTGDRAAHCACLRSAIACIAEDRCSSAVVAQIRTHNATSSQLGCPPVALNVSVFVSSNPSIDVYVSKVSDSTARALSRGSGVQDFDYIRNEEMGTFELPTTSDEAQWMSVSDGSHVTERRLAIWESDGYDQDADRVLIAVRANTDAAKVEVRVSDLAAFPVTVSGTLMAPGGVRAEQIRAGGLTLELSLACDLFMDPHAFAAVMEESNTDPNVAFGFEVAEAAQRLSMKTQAPTNLLAPGALLIGTTALEASDHGWNRYAKPELLTRHLSDPTLVRFSFGNSLARITLPPLPAYNPSSDETITITIPGALLRSGKDTVVPGVRIRIAADQSACSVSDWSRWSYCSEICRPGTQARTRAVTRLPSGGGAACPDLVERRTCNTCDLCSTVTCRNGGVCAGGRCVCQPGFTGSDCSAPPPGIQVAFWRTAEWGACTAHCGGGRQQREVECLLLSADGALPTAAARCSAVAPRPESERSCNAHACSLSYATLNLTLAVSAGAITGSDGIRQAFESTVTDELADALQLSSDRIAIDTLGPDFSGNGTSDGEAAHLFIVLRLSPPTDSSSTSEDAASSRRRASSGASVEDSIAQLRQSAADPASPLRTRGTFLNRLDPTSLSFTVRLGIDGAVVGQGTGVAVVPQATSTPVAQTATDAPTPREPSDADNSDDGDEVNQLRSSLIAVGTILGVAIVGGVAAAGVWWTRHRRQPPPGRKPAANPATATSLAPTPATPSITTANPLARFTLPTTVSIAVDGTDGAGAAHVAATPTHARRV